MRFWERNTGGDVVVVVRNANVGAGRQRWTRFCCWLPNRFGTGKVYGVRRVAASATRVVDGRARRLVGFWE